MTRTLAALALASLLAAGPGDPAAAQDVNAAPPNAPHQAPAFDAQARAPVIADPITLDRAVVADGLTHPWGMGRVRDVDVARDGAVMILTDAANGALIRLTPGE